ncbi:ATP-binding protein [Actinoplanes sp. NPDC051494]|uniref:ATP-binding protein n=1 Tax=Actinoplanes sp. NPDC051494 TaxID=3363907 RepID=UPI003798FF8E
MIGERIRVRRRELGLTQEELAERAGIDVKTVRMIETGKRTPRPATARSLAEALDLDSVRTDTTGPVPAQLPPDVYGFVGREAQLRALDAITAAPGDRPSAVVISALSGSAGIGKTTLAVHWAHRARDRFPDGQLYADLRGFDPGGATSDPAQVLLGFLGALDVPARKIPAGLDDRAALYRSVLADRRMLVLLDNARDAAQVRPLLPGAPGSMALVTSRDDLAGLVVRHGAHPLGLHLLSTDESFQLLARRLGEDRLATAPDAVEEIIERCARLPLALTIAAARAATRPGVSLDALAAELRDVRGRLDTLAVGDPAGDVRAVFSWSYTTLSDGAARLFRLLGIHPGPEVSVAVAASVLGEPVVRTRLLLAELTQASLLTERSAGRFGFHDLLRAYAAELALGDPDADAAARRMLDHYLQSALAADRVLLTRRHQVAAPPPAPVPGIEVTEPPGTEEALAWFLEEYRVLLTLLARTGDDVHVWHLAWAMSPYFNRRALFHDWVGAQLLAMAAAERLGDRDRQVRTQNDLAIAYFSVGRTDEAMHHLRLALTLFEELGDRTGQAGGNLNLGSMLQIGGRHTEALDHLEQALELFRELGAIEGQASALNAIGLGRVRLGEYEKALAYCTESVDLRLRSGAHHAGRAASWDSLGEVHRHLGHHDEALRCFDEALTAYRAAGSPHNEADVLLHIGDTHDATGDRNRARDHWRRALTILESIDHPDAAGVRARLEP